MQTLRQHHRWLSFFFALWICATLAAAALTPLFKKADITSFAMLCTSMGKKLVNLDAEGKPATAAATHALDCPGCLSQFIAAPPPAVHISSLPMQRFDAPAFFTSAYASRATLSASARGPPAFV